MKYDNLLSHAVPTPSIQVANHAAAAAFSNAGSWVNRGTARMALVSLLVGAVPSAHTLDVKLQGRTNDGVTQGAATDLVGENGSTLLQFAQRTNANSGTAGAGNLFGLLYLAELPYDDYRAVATIVGASGVPFAVNFTLYDFPEMPPTNPAAKANAFASIHGVIART